MPQKAGKNVIIWVVAVLLALSAAGSGSVVILADESGATDVTLAEDECLLDGHVVKKADVPDGMHCDEPPAEGDQTAPQPPTDPAPPADPPTPDPGATSTTADAAQPDGGQAPPTNDGSQVATPPTGSTQSDTSTTPTTTAPTSDTTATAPTADAGSGPTTSAPADGGGSQPATTTPDAPVSHVGDTKQPGDTSTPRVPATPGIERHTKKPATPEEPPFQDARLFREHFVPTGRIPDLPQLDTSASRVFVAQGKERKVRWAMLAAISWMDSRWGNPVAGGLAGQDLTDADWARYGVDGNGDGRVSRSSDADCVATVAAFLAAHTKPHHPFAAIAAYFHGDGPKARRARYLAAYYDAMGPRALTRGLNDDDAQQALADRVLRDDRVDIYEAGRDDVFQGLVDPRVLVTLEFLANRYHTVKVCSLISGHSVFTKSGRVSNHAKGQAADVCVLDDVAIYGHQQHDSVTVKAVKDLLRMPATLDLEEAITLWDFGPPSFALADHDDHIHVGFDDPSAPA